MNANHSGSTVKLKLKIGTAEIDYEGNEAFLIDHVFRVFERALSANPISDEPDTKPPASEGDSRGEIHHLATNSIASILNVDSGPELIVAAAAHLDLVQGKESFSRSDLRQEMRNATRFFKSSYTSNLSSYIGNLVKSEQLHEIGQETYALPEGKRQSLKAQLDEHR